MHGQTKGGKSTVLFGDEKHKGKGVLYKSVKRIFKTSEKNSVAGT